MSEFLFVLSLLVTVAFVFAGMIAASREDDPILGRAIGVYLVIAILSPPLLILWALFLISCGVYGLPSL